MIRTSKKSREKSKKMLLIIKNKKKPRLTVADPGLQIKFKPKLEALISLQPTGPNCQSSVDCGKALIWCDFILGRFLFSFILLALGIR